MVSWTVQCFCRQISKKLDAKKNIRGRKVRFLREALLTFVHGLELVFPPSPAAASSENN